MPKRFMRNNACSISFKSSTISPTPYRTDALKRARYRRPAARLPLPGLGLTTSPCSIMRFHRFIRNMSLSPSVRARRSVIQWPTSGLRRSAACCWKSEKLELARTDANSCGEISNVSPRSTVHERSSSNAPSLSAEPERDSRSKLSLSALVRRKELRRRIESAASVSVTSVHGASPIYDSRSGESVAVSHVKRKRVSSFDSSCITSSCGSMLSLLSIAPSFNTDLVSSGIAAAALSAPSMRSV
mmetsp:Transcript_33249/g.87900  ORF Transcript_33249/g.87900 Transcript_33249/m.87900 type:complete len:243 (+) Transcript_33249:603-1331(+)